MVKNSHLFLAPHPDDAVLSCGGIIATLVEQVEQVDIFTLMAADPPDPLPKSPFIDDLHKRWGTDENPSAIRRAEDRAAVETLGAQVLFGTWHDCIYRTDENGHVLYRNDDDLFGDVKQNDPLLNETLNLSSWPDISHLYIPLGAGNHVDHRLVRQKALAWLNETPKAVAIFFYEEYPYSADTNEVYHSHAGVSERLSGLNAIEVARKSLELTVAPVIQEITINALKLKIDAIQCYASQLSSFWMNTAQMAESVELNARNIGQIVGSPLAERLWAVK